jgi:ABC-type transporter Mla subunit MlaD
MLIAALMIYLTTLFGGGGGAMGPILTEVNDARDRVHLIASSDEDRKAIIDRIDAVLAASESRTDDIERFSDRLREVNARHDATREELTQVVDALHEASRAELDATLEAYLVLRQSLTAEQWIMLFPPPSNPADPQPDA